ncbi:MAG: PaaI family thioesterase [Methanoregula sp.]|nr:MAG: PaaI family thioesterase [Methanoregula sp.]
MVRYSDPKKEILHTSHTSIPGKVQERIAVFDESEFARLLELEVIEARDGYARVFMPSVKKNNPNGVIHGGAVFSLADHAFGMAANAGTVHRVAVSIHIQYIAPARGDLEAIAELVAENGRYSTFRVMVYEGDSPVAEFDGVAIRTSS